MPLDTALILIDRLVSSLAMADGIDQCSPYERLTTRRMLVIKRELEGVVKLPCVWVTNISRIRHRPCLPPRYGINLDRPFGLVRLLWRMGWG